MSATVPLTLVWSVPLHSPRRGIRSGIVATVAFGALAVLMAAAPVTGQTVATTFDELRLKVKAGDTVYVTNYSGRSEQEARILELTGSSLALSIDGIQRDLVESDVMRIRQRLPDSRKNGALIGFLVGAAGITTGAIVMASPSGSCTGGCVAVNVLYGGGVGALVGLGIDALIQGRKDIYVKSRSQASLDVGVQPFFSSRAKGLSVSVSF